ncbi:MAG: VWA domain-containing protein [Spirochaetes bacterium]|nr:VWA domain-containing protein [Spirochaetota bacterium]MBU0957169.1 VWA domain-containing protein [Spirochaetota bacterium]
MRIAALILILLTSGLSLQAENRAVSVDFFILLDVSLSMEGAPIRDARDFTAQNIIGALVQPQDWLCLIKFWGESEILWQDTIQSQADTYQLIRTLGGISADGRFTDIGTALDFMGKILEERGRPERPKYILLITDEIQEAPVGSRYYAPDNKLNHTMLDYVHRIDRGLYKVITIGYPKQDEIEESARTLYELLSNPPLRPAVVLPGAPPGTTVITNENPLSAVSESGKTEDNTAGAATGTAGSPDTEDTKQGASMLLLILLPALFLAVLVCILVLIVIPGLRRKKRAAKHQEEPNGDH